MKKLIIRDLQSHQGVDVDGKKGHITFIFRNYFEIQFEDGENTLYHQEDLDKGKVKLL